MSDINPLRDAMVRFALQKNFGNPVTVENVAKFLPEDFELIEDDLAPHRETAAYMGPAETVAVDLIGRGSAACPGSGSRAGSACPHSRARRCPLVASRCRAADC